MTDLKSLIKERGREDLIVKGVFDPSWVGTGSSVLAGTDVFDTTCIFFPEGREMRVIVRDWVDLGSTTEGES